MYNWIPLGEREQEVGDPLMVLPRLWANPQLVEHLRTAAEIGEAAAMQALQNYPREAEYYRAVCGADLPARRDTLPQVWDALLSRRLGNLREGEGWITQ
jgi:hypothetical protein